MFGVVGVLGVVLPNGLEVDLTSNTNIAARRLLSGQQAILLLQPLKTLEAGPVVCSLACGSMITNGCVVWSHNRIPFNTEKFAKTPDQTGIYVVESGIYRIDMKLLNTGSAALYPFLEINGKPEIYCFAATSGFCDAHTNIVVELPVNAIIRVKFQNGGVTMFSNTSEAHSYL